VSAGVSKLALREVTCRFGAVTAVDRATLALARGEFVSLLGPSGCGKTTTLRMIAGFLDPTEGTIELDGRAISAPGNSLPPEKRGMSMIFQSYAIWPNMTVAENVGFGLEVRRLPRAEIRDKVDRILDVVRMRHLRDRYPAELSGGQQQRVALARAIVVQPDVLLLDEPLSGMDPVNRRRTVDLIKRLGREGKTVLVSSHILHEVEAMTRRVLLIHNGRILAEGDVREIRDLMDEHPHTVALRARDTRALARAVVGLPHVISLTFGPEGEWLTVQTAKPDELYGNLAAAAEEAGVSEMYSPDENLESVFRYLVTG